MALNECAGQTVKLTSYQGGAGRGAHGGCCVCILELHALGLQGVRKLQVLGSKVFGEPEGCSCAQSWLCVGSCAGA